MGHYDSPAATSANLGFLGGNTGTFIAGGAIANGEVVLLHEGGLTLRADPEWPWAALTNSTAGISIPLFSPTTLPNISVSGQTAQKCVGHPALVPNPLSASNLCSSYLYAVPVQTSSGIGFILRNSTGLQVGNFVLVSSDSCSMFPQITPVTSSGFNGFAIHWINSSGALRCASYNWLGIQVVGATTIASSVSTSYQAPWWGCCSNGDGTITFTYLTTSSVHAAVSFTASTLIVSTSAWNIDTSVHSGFFAIIPSAVTANDIIISAWDANASRFKIYRTTSTNTVKWGPVSPSSAASFWTQPSTYNFHPSTNRIVEVSSGALFFMLPNTSGYGNVWQLTSSGGTPSTNSQIDWGTQYHDSGTAHPLVQTPNGFCVFHANNTANSVSTGSTTYCSYYDIAGNPTNINTLCDSTAPAPTNSGQYCNTYGALAGPYATCMRYTNDGNGNIEVRSIHVDHRGDPVCPPIIHQPKTASDCSAPIIKCNPDGSLFSAFFSVSTVQVFVTCAKIGRCAVLGVAQSSAVAGGSFTVDSAGSFTTPATQTFGPGFTFDMRNQPILGARGTIGGNVATLAGWY